jgi:uncharacterized membrane protein SpoIIM required for sporulation
MKVADILERRRANWEELERLSAQMESVGRRKMAAPDVSRFAALYRAACADLALADAYQLPPNTVQYLHRLVGKAHNQFYRARQFKFQTWKRILIDEVPQRIFHDRCVQLMFVLFWGMFILSMIMARYNRPFAEKLIGQQMMNFMEESHGSREDGNSVISPYAVSYYIQHNTSIGLQCFTGGILVVPGIAITIYNAAILGAVFGYMSTVPAAPKFFNFVTAHGPFELTAIALAAGAGLRLGMGWLYTTIRRADLNLDWQRAKFSADDAETADDQLDEAPLTRESSLVRAGIQAMPIMGASIILFFLAAMIEGFLSPSTLPYWVKAGVAILSTIAMLFYFVVLGFPRRARHAT